MNSYQRLMSLASKKRLSKSRAGRRATQRTEDKRLLRCEHLETRVMLASDLPFSPALGLEASDGVIFDSQTGAVSQWQDQSGSNNHVQALGSEQPTLGTTQTPSGLDAISFDGVDDRLLRTLTDPGGISGLPLNNRDRSVFLIAQFHDATGFGGAAYGRGTVNQAFGTGVAGSGGELVVQGWGSGNDFLSTELGFNPPGATSGWMLLSVVHTKDNNNPADNAFVYQNGVEILSFDHKFNTKLTSTVDLNGNTAARMVIGQEIKEQGFIEIDIAAWAVYDQALDTTDRQAVETYLTNKYLTPLANQAPVAADDSVTVDDGGVVVIDVLANDTDTDGTINPTSVVIVDQPSQAASISVDPVTGQISYTHNGLGLADSFTYTVLDDEGAVSNTATVTVNLTPPNQAPVANQDFVFVDSGGSATFNILGNDTDADGTIDPTSIVIIDQPFQAASISVDPITGEVNYTHNGTLHNDIFTYTVLDNEGAISNVGSVAIILNPSNQAPTAADDVLAVDDGAAILIDILANDTDADGTIDPTSVVIVDQPSQATSISVDPVTGQVSYSHDGSGLADSFTYTVLDDEGAISNTATVTINLTPPNQAPVAVDDGLTIDDGETVVIALLANDTDADGTINPNRVSLVDFPQHASGLLLNLLTGEVTYTHDGSATPDSFSYTVLDNDGAVSNVATVTINIASLNQAPITTDDGITLDNGTATTIDILTNDTDVDGTLDPTSVVIVAQPLQAASFSVDPITGVVSYTHNGSGLADSFTYTVLDNDGAISNTSTVTINVTVPNQAPIATNDSETIGNGGSVVIDLLFNDSDVDGTIDPTSVVIVDQPSQAASFSVNPTTGQVIYTHNGSGSTDSFTYTVLDNLGQISNIATVSINITPANQTPVAIDDSATIDDGASTVISILANDTDADGTVDPTSVVIVDQPLQAASFSVDAVTGEVSYTHNGSGLADSFTYTVLDDQGLISNVATVDILIGQQPLSLVGFSSELATSTGLSQPISLGFFPDGRMLILQKEGEILLVDPNTGVQSVYMTLTNINSGGEKGLLDISVAPDFDPNTPGDDYIYLYYTPASPQQARIARFTHQQNSGGLTSTGDLSSEFLVWEDTDGYISCCHFGGGLDHGPDGKLWLTSSDKFTAPNTGEGSTNENLPQDLTTTGGKIIRVNPDGSIPDGTDGWAANPFIDSVDDDPNIAGNQDYLDSIWGYGLRNPFRARWDIQSGRFFIAEVGGNVQTTAHEDIHIATLDNPGANFGWPYYEGTGPTEVLDPNGTFAPTHGFTPIDIDLPIFSVPHDGSGASITGGEVYRGTQFPAEWDGVYFYGDYTRDYVRYLTFDETGEVTGDFPFMPTAEITNVPNQIVNISVGPDGALYYVLIGGQVRRVIHSSTNQAPQIQLASADVSSGDAPLSVNFTADVSDPESDAMTFTWHFGDGNSVAGNVVNGVATAPYTYLANGTFNAYVEISDANQTVFSTFVPIQVGASNAPPTISQEAVSPESGDSPLEVIFTAQANDLNGDPLTYEVIFGNGNTSGLKAVPLSGNISEVYTYNDDGSYNAFIVVSDGTDSTQSLTLEVVVGATQIPPITDGLVLLLESDIKIGVSTGNTVVSWLDGSGNGNNFDAAGDPQLVPNSTPGGQPAIVFDGVGDMLQRLAVDTINNFPAGADDRTVFTVVNYVDAQGVQAGFSFGKANFNRAFGLVADGSTGNLTVESGANANDLNSATPGVGAGWLTQSVIVSSNSVTQYNGGTPIGSLTNTYQTRLDAPNSRIVIAEALGGLGQMQVEYAAILVYDRALSETERQQVENYLQSKYIVGNFPPVAGDDNGLVATGAAAVIDVLANDSDADGILNPASVIIVDQPLNGTVTIEPLTGAITYTHDGGVSASDTFTYTVNDEVSATSNVATVTITVGSGSLVTSGLVVSLETDAGLSTDGGNNVLSWLDSSGLGNDLQTVIGDPIVVSAATPSGADAINFDGDDSLARLGVTDTLNGLSTGAADRTVFIVAQFNTATALAGVAYGSGAANANFGLTADSPQGNLAVQGGGAGNNFVSTNQGSGTGWLLQSAVLSANQLDHYRDGELVDSAFHMFNTEATDLMIAQEIDGAGFAGMDVAAVLIYDRALTEMERHEVQAYLHSKYF